MPSSDSLIKSEVYLSIKKKYDKYQLFDDQLIDILIRSELYKTSSILSKYKKDLVEKFFLKEISIKSSIILTLLFSFYDLSYLLYNYAETQNHKDHLHVFGKL